MKKEILILIVIVAVGAILAVGSGFFNKEEGERSRFSLSALSPSSLFGSKNLTPAEASVAAWQTFDAYMEAAKTHNLESLTALSHQLSPACLDTTRQDECFALMDSVYTIGSSLDNAEFKYVEVDSKQIVMWTDGPGVAILYFTREGRRAPKVLGLQFCLEIEGGDKCAEPEVLRADANKETVGGTVLKPFSTERLEAIERPPEGKDNSLIPKRE